MKRVLFVARMARTSSAYKILVRNPRGRGLVEDLGVDGKVMLTLILLMWSIG